MSWAAGIFEGEGHVGLLRGRFGILKVQMVDRDIIERFHVVVGVGSVHEARSRRPEHSDSFVWRVQDKAGVVHVMTMLRPYMGARRGARFDEVTAAMAGVRARKLRGSVAGRR